MVSIEECKRILNKSGKAYTDTEVEKIRDVLYKLANIEIEGFKRGFWPPQGCSEDDKAK